MSEKNSLLSSVINDIEKSKKESAKAKLKDLLNKREQAKDVVKGIEDSIIELLTSVGEDPADVAAALAD